MESHVANNQSWSSRCFWNRVSYGALWFNALGAAVGAWYLLGRPVPMPLAYLEGSPFPDYTVPGIVLLIAVGGSSLLAAIARWRHWQYEFLLTLAAGCVLLGWLFFEFLWLPEGWAAQLLFAAVGTVITVGGYQGWHRQTS